MSRMSYKTALRAKGIKPIPPAKSLRSSLTKEGHHIVTPRREIVQRPPAVLDLGGKLIRLIRREA